MTSSATAPTIEKDTRIPPRERLLAAAADLFYRQGIRAVGVESIAEAAGTNKTTLYPHFESKDELVAEYLRRLAAASMAEWDKLTAAHRGDARGELRAWLQAMAGHVASGDERGCALVNAAVELPDKAHPARRVIEQLKVEQR